MASFEGVILKTVDYKESSKLLYVYTPSGIKSMLARGVKKMTSPFRHSAQTGMHAVFHVSEGKLPTVRDIELLNYYKDIKKDYMKQSVVGVVNALIYFNVTQHDNHHKLYSFLLKVYQTLEATHYALEVLCIFELKFLYFLGNAINLKACIACQRTESLYFDGIEGSVVCQAHLPSHRQIYDSQIVDYMRYFYYLDIAKFQPLELDNKTMLLIFEITDGLYKHHTDFVNKSKTLLKSLL